MKLAILLVMISQLFAKSNWDVAVSNYGDILSAVKQLRRKPIISDHTSTEPFVLWFFSYDFNNDQMLDGHELMFAFAGHLETQVNKAEYKLADLMKFADHALKEDDDNGDGKIDINEYLQSLAYHHQYKGYVTPAPK